MISALRRVSRAARADRSVTCRFYSGASSQSLSGVGVTWEYTIANKGTVLLPLTGRWEVPAGARVVAVRCSASSSGSISSVTASLAGVLAEN